MSALGISDGNAEEGLFEGCGREGPILAIFLAEFHHTAGPKIVYQHPKDTIPKDIFDAVSSYIIPKTHLQRITMTVNVLGKKIIGYPIQIKNDKYERNAFYFNTCLVCDAWARTVQYESVLVKLAEFFCNLELETEYLSRNSTLTPEVETELMTMIQNVVKGLNGQKREVFYVFKQRLLALKVVPAVLDDPPWVVGHEVPVFVLDVGSVEKWDLTTQQIIPYVNGFSNVAQISHLADVHVNLVRSCVQNLLYYNVVKLVPAFQYGNSYCLTPDFHLKFIRGEEEFRDECCFFVAKNDHTKPNLVDVMKFYGSMKQGITVKQLCLRFKGQPALPTVRIITLDGKRYTPSKFSDHSLSSSLQSRSSSNPTTPIKGPPQIRTASSKRPSGDKLQTVLNIIDERRLVLFGLVHGIIRRVDKYPMFESNTQQSRRNLTTPYRFGRAEGTEIEVGASSEGEGKDVWEKHRKKYLSIYEMCDGSNDFDKICLAHELSQTQLEDIIDRDPDVFIVWR